MPTSAPEVLGPHLPSSLDPRAWTPIFTSSTDTPQVSAGPPSVPAQTQNSATPAPSVPAVVPQIAPTPAVPAPATPAAAPAAQQRQPQPSNGNAQAAPQAAPAPVAIPEEITKPIDALNEKMKAIEDSIDGSAMSDRTLAELRTQAQTIISSANKFADELKPRQRSVQQQIDKLGPAPGKDAAPESGAAAQERQRLGALLSAITGSIKTADLIAERASQSIDKIQVAQRELFAKSILERSTNPLNPKHAGELLKAAALAFKNASGLLGNWWTSVTKQFAVLLPVLGLIALVWVGLRLINGHLFRRSLDRVDTPPSFFSRVAAATWVAPMLMLPGAAAAGLVYLTLNHLELLTFGVSRIGTAVLTAVLIVSGVYGLATALLSPRRPDWRLFDLPQRSARRMRRLISLIAVVYGVDLVLTEFLRAVLAPISLTIAQSFVANLLFAALLIALLRIPFNLAPPPAALEAESAPDAGDPEPAGGTASARPKNGSALRPFWLKLPLWALALGIIGATLTGYVALARFLVGQIVVTGMIVVAFMLLHHAVRAIASDLISPSQTLGQRLAGIGIEENRRKQIAFVLSVLLNLVLLVVAVPLILIQWGFAWADVQDWLRSAVFGFSVGGIEISLVRIMIAAAILAAGIVVTNMVKQSLDRTVLQAPRMDPGIANSVRTAVGYAGFIASALLAAAYAGLNFTNLAIVAGALSVGIGFGLQSIVNNFVSGLILLVERPVKVGDWIVVGGDKEGFVRRISVRSTEIETFDRSSVIVPNSELITGTVVNWTHRNSVGRVIVRVGVSYDADPTRVCEILNQIAMDHPAVLQYPSPVVAFEDFGASSLDFSLRAYIGDITKALTVRTELRIAILEAFRKEGVEIPFPQQDVHLRDLDPVRGALARAIEERQRREGQA